MLKKRKKSKQAPAPPVAINPLFGRPTIQKTKEPTKAELKATLFKEKAAAKEIKTKERRETKAKLWEEVRKNRFYPDVKFDVAVLLAFFVVNVGFLIWCVTRDSLLWHNVLLALLLLATVATTVSAFEATDISVKNRLISIMGGVWPWFAPVVGLATLAMWGCFVYAIYDTVGMYQDKSARSALIQKKTKAEKDKIAAENKKQETIQASRDAARTAKLEAEGAKAVGALIQAKSAVLAARCNATNRRAFESEARVLMLDIKTDGYKQVGASIQKAYKSQIQDCK